jgi:hypothetical protein
MELDSAKGRNDDDEEEVKRKLRLSKDLKKVCTYFDNVKRQLSKFLP